MKAIETRYAGCHFRSRLEARWAVFFDHMDIGWQYEPQGFMINDRPYLPDFLLDCGTWVEVKGDEQSLDRNLMLAAAEQLPPMPCIYEAGPRLLILGPIPEPPVYEDLGWLGLDPSPIGVSVPAARWTQTVRNRLEEILQSHPGAWPLYVDLVGGVLDEYTGIGAQVDRSEALFSELERLVGPGGVQRIHRSRHGFGPHRKNKRPWWLYNHRAVNGWLTPVLDTEWSESYAREAYVAARSARFEHGQSGI